MAQKVELRKRNGNFAGDDNLMLPVTHVKAVLGLLDGNDQLNTSLLPSSMLNTKRMAGTINSDTNFNSLYSLIKTFNGSDISDIPMYPGSYFISNGKNLISASTDHVIQYNDDGLNASDSVELEHGDHLFYVKYVEEGSESSWEFTGERLHVLSGEGVADLDPPYNTIQGSRIFATESEAISATPETGGLYALVTGFKWVPSNATAYNSTQGKMDKTSGFGSTPTVAQVNHLAIPTFDLYDHGQSNLVLKISDTEGGISYWKLTKVDETFQGRPKAYESVLYSDKHIWGVVNNSYDLATATSAGLMSASDKVKLSSLENYVHPTDYIVRNINNATGVNVIDKFESDSLGHVKNITVRPLPSANTDTVGVVQLATAEEGQDVTSSLKALTPVSGLAMLNYNQDVSYFGSETLANGAALPDGAIAIITQPGNITID